MRRRDLLLSALLPVLPAARAQESPHRGRLMIVGGAEDRVHDRLILRRFLDEAGGPGARIRLLTAASGQPHATAASYEQAFAELGARDCRMLPLTERTAAFLPEVAREIRQADGIFISGGDQGRLMETLWETPVPRALHEAYHHGGCSIGGTSAGAAVMSRHMIAQGPAVFQPRKDVVDTDVGLSLLPAAIVDQHFSQRRRLARLLSALARRPDLLGVGVDEDTALLVEPEIALEVVGAGMVTLVDASAARSNITEAREEGQLELLGLQLHTLPAGRRYVAHPDAPDAGWPGSLQAALRRLVRPGPTWV